MSTLAERLKEAMKGPPEVNQGELAHACGVKQPSVSAWLSGKTKRLEGTNLYRAAIKLNVSQLWLAEGRGSMRQKEGEARVATAETVDLKDWLSADELALIETYGKLSPAKQKVLMRFVRTFVEPSADSNAGDDLLS